MPPRDLARYQEGFLVRLVRHAHERLPFYRDRLAPLFSPDGKIDLSCWNEVPILKRDQVVAMGREMRVAELPPGYGAIGEFRTSGSTGIPLEIASNGLVFLTANALFTRMASWFGLDLTKPLASIRRFTNEPNPPGPHGQVSVGWSLGKQSGPLYEFELMTPVEQQLEWLSLHKAPYLLTQPSGALALSHAITTAQRQALGIEFVFLAGETIPNGAREFIAERLGARAAGIYSCQEIGMLACECETAPHYHVAAENALVEIVDDHGRDVAVGERGRTVVTGLFNYAMPFIRYELGDIALAGNAPCRCGRTLPVISEIEGRSRNVFVFRDGSRIWPRAAMVRPMQAYVPFLRFQLVQLDHERIELRYISDGSGRLPDLDGLNAYARKVLHPSIELSIREMTTFTPGPGGKIEEFISHIPAATTLRWGSNDEGAGSLP